MSHPETTGASLSVIDSRTREAICDEWIARVFGGSFIKRASAGLLEDPFFHTVRSEWGAILGILYSSQPVDESLSLPEEYIRLRAVQEISAAEAVSHIFVLKDIVRERHGQEKGYEDLSRRLDMLALHTFNSYVQCRDRLFQIRLKEIKQYGAAETFACSRPD